MCVAFILSDDRMFLPAVIRRLDDDLSLGSVSLEYLPSGCSFRYHHVILPRWGRPQRFVTLNSHAPEFSVSSHASTKEARSAARNLKNPPTDGLSIRAQSQVTFAVDHPSWNELSANIVRCLPADDRQESHQETFLRRTSCKSSKMSLRTCPTFCTI